MTKSPAYFKYKNKHKQITFQISVDEYEQISKKVSNVNAYAKSVFLKSFSSENEDMESVIAEKYEQRIKELEDKIIKLREINDSLLA